MFKLNERIKNNIAISTGISFEEISKLSAQEIDERIEKKLHKKLEPENPTDIRRLGRGTPYLFLNRLVPIDWINKQLSKI